MNMDSNARTFNVLLIDDEIEELAIIQQVYKVLNYAPVTVDHAYKCSEAVNLLNQHHYDLVLLDNRLSGHISAEFSAPFILSAINKSTVAIISNDIGAPYLKNPHVLGVDYVVDKAKIIAFLRDQYAGSLHAEVHCEAPLTPPPTFQ